MKSRNISRHFFGLMLAMVGLMSGLALPGYCWSYGFSDQAIIPLAVNSGWSKTGNLLTSRRTHSATLLPNGKVLVAGGVGNEFYLSSAELYDPDTGAWSNTGNLNAPRFDTATLLPSGKVLVAGGIDNGFKPLSSAELYDPDTGTWSNTGNLNIPRSGYTATLLPNGTVLVAGGYGNDNLGNLNSAEIYDPATGTWSVTGNLVVARYWHTATLLQNGKVLIAGGTDDGDLSSTLASAEIYDPDTGTWSITGDLNASRVFPTATLLPNGEVLVAGGYDWPPVSLSGAELYDPASGRWRKTGNLKAARNSHTATLLPNGTVLIAGGEVWGGSIPNAFPKQLKSAELYYPDTGIWGNTATLNTPHTKYTATLLPSGKVLVAGGIETGLVSNSAELYNSEDIVPIPIPRIIGASALGKKLFVSGENFDPGAVILLNGEELATTNDDQNPQTTLISKKAGKKIKAGDKLQVRNSNGAMSQEFTFTGS